MEQRFERMRVDETKVATKETKNAWPRGSNCRQDREQQSVRVRFSTKRLCEATVIASSQHTLSIVIFVKRASKICTINRASDEKSVLPKLLLTKMET